MEIEKWYFDVQHKDTFGYYYVGLIRFLGLTFSFCEVTHLDPSNPIHFYESRFSGETSPSNIHTPNAHIHFTDHDTGLEIHNEEYQLRGNWSPRVEGPALPKSPIYENENGYCLWKILAPRAKVHLNVKGAPTFTAEGFGYIDYVKLTIPVWKLPFNTLHWGRLYSSQNDWLVFFHLDSDREQLVYMGSISGWILGSEVAVTRNPDYSITDFSWNFNDRQIVVKTVQPYRREMILNTKRMKWLPKFIRKKGSSYGYEEKYEVEARYEGKTYKGIMEEVSWNVPTYIV